MVWWVTLSIAQLPLKMMFACCSPNNCKFSNNLIIADSDDFGLKLGVEISSRIDCKRISERTWCTKYERDWGEGIVDMQFSSYFYRCAPCSCHVSSNFAATFSILRWAFLIFCEEWAQSSHLL